jgi:hypothetical protein
MTKAERFHAGIQTTLLLIEQAIEEDNGCFEFIGRDLKQRGISHCQWQDLGCSARADLVSAVAGSGGSVEVVAGYLCPTEALLLDQLAQRFLHLDVQGTCQLFSEVAICRTVDEGFDSGEQSALTRKANRLIGPEAEVIEARNCRQRVVTAAVAVAGEIVEQFKLAEDGEVGAGAESALKLGEGGDLVAPEEAAQGVRVESSRSHYDKAKSIVNGQHLEAYLSDSAGRNYVHRLALSLLHNDGITTSNVQVLLSEPLVRGIADLLIVLALFRVLLRPRANASVRCAWTPDVTTLTKRKYLPDNLRAIVHQFV